MVAQTRRAFGDASRSSASDPDPTSPAIDRVQPTALTTPDAPVATAPPAAGGGRAAARWPAALLALVLPALAGAAAVAASWERWINPLVDSGREMDVPWRLVQGERLYADITYYYGPLGPWLNAAVLRLLGGRWIVLQALCMLLGAAIFWLLYRLTRAAASRTAAIAATSLGAALCMGAPNGGAFLFPYSTSCLLALAAALAALWASCLRPRPAVTALAAAALAVALATRVEVGLAAAAALVIAGGRSCPRRETLRRTLVVVTSAALLAGALYAVALHGLTWHEMRHDGPLTPFAGMPREWARLYLHVAGLDTPWKTAGTFGLALVLDGLMLAFLGLCALPARQAPADAALAAAPRRRGLRLERLLFPGLALAVVAAYLASPFAEPFKNLPPMVTVLPVAAAIAACALLRRPLAGRDRARFLLFAFSAAVAVRVALGLAIGPKMGPYSTLPLPGLIATMAVLVFDGLAPRLPRPAVFRRRFAALLAVVAVVFLYRLDRVEHRPGTRVLATEGGELRLPAREAQVLGQTLAYLAARAHPGDTLTAFPESGFFNFVTGLRNPLRQDEMLPGVCDSEHETEVTRRIELAGPRFVLLCNRPTSEYGPASFGADYYAALWSAVERRYTLRAAFGRARPTAQVGAGRFFIRIYERLPEPGVPALRLAAAHPAPPPPPPPARRAAAGVTTLAAFRPPPAAAFRSAPAAAFRPAAAAYHP
jgi:hypothetical protein